MFCRFDSSVHSDAPKYSFVYQMRIMPHSEENSQNEEVKEEDGQISGSASDEALGNTEQINTTT